MFTPRHVLSFLTPRALLRTLCREKTIERLRDFFDAIDEDGGGTLDADEIAEAMRNMGQVCLSFFYSPLSRCPQRQLFIFLPLSWKMMSSGYYCA